MPQECGESPHKPRIPTSPIPQLAFVLQCVRHDALRIDGGSHQYILILFPRCCIVDLGLERGVERSWLMRVRDYHIVEAEESECKITFRKRYLAIFCKKWSSNHTSNYLSSLVRRLIYQKISCTRTVITWTPSGASSTLRVSLSKFAAALLGLYTPSTIVSSTDSHARRSGNQTCERLCHLPNDTPNVDDLPLRLDQAWSKGLSHSQ